MSERRIDDAGVAGGLHDDGAACSVEHLEWGGTWPDRAQFHRLADAGYRVVPIVRRLLADSLTPVGFTSVSPGAVRERSFWNRRNTAVPGADTASSASIR